MQQSDQLLIQSLRQYLPVPQHLKMLSQIHSEQLFNISLQFFSRLSIDIADIKNMKPERFRSITKLNHLLNLHIQQQFELNDLMNPSVPFLRRILLSFINCISSHIEEQGSSQDGKDKHQTYKNTKSTNWKKQAYNRWFNQEWIHPSLVDPKPYYKAYKYPISYNRLLLERNIVKQLSQKNNIRDIKTILNITCKKRKNIQNKKIKKQQEIINRINRNEKDWNIQGMQIKRLKKKINQSIIKDNQLIQQSYFHSQMQELKINQENVQNNRKISNTLTLDNIINTENPIETLQKEQEQKIRKYEIIIQELLNKMQQKKEQMEDLEKHKEKLQDIIGSKKEKMKFYQQDIKVVKKRAQKKQIMLNTLQGEKSITEQIKILEKDISQLQIQGKTEIEKLQQNIKQFNNQTKQKNDLVQELKLELQKVQNDYHNTCEEILEKKALKDKAKVTKSGISRDYYSKKILEIDARWKATTQQAMKMRKSLVTATQKAELTISMARKVEKEIENTSLNRSKTPQGKALKEAFRKCSNTLSNTFKVLQDVKEVKRETHQLQLKVQRLSSKNYQSSISKLKATIDQLRKEMTETHRKSTNKKNK